MPQNMSRVTHHHIADNEAGQRLDNFLLRIWKGVPKSHVYRLLRSGQVRVNGKRAKPSQRVESGDDVRLPPVRLGEQRSERRAPDELLERLAASVLYEDDRIIALNKPSGLAVHGGSGQAYGLIECFRQLRSDALELAHRLDRETSGVLLLAKQREVLNELHTALRDGVLDKRYQLLVQGRWSGPANVEAALVPDRQGGQHGMAVAENGDPDEGPNTGKASKTGFHVDKPFKGSTLMTARLYTGRMHQIRVHCASTGHPVAGDRRYGEQGYNKMMRGLGLKRLFLHARQLTLPESVLGHELCFQAPLPDELNAVLNKLELLNE